MSYDQLVYFPRKYSTNMIQGYLQSIISMWSEVLVGELVCDGGLSCNLLHFVRYMSIECGV